MICLYIALGILLYVELYSAGVYVLAGRSGYEKPLKNFIPFYAFRTLGVLTAGFSVLAIPVRKPATTAVILAVCPLAACAFGVWGDHYLPEVSRVSLWQIMLVITGVCAAVFYVFLLMSSVKVYRRFRVRKEWLWVLLSVPLITIPVLFVIAGRNQPRCDQEMY